MNWITLICCLLALSSSVFGRSAFGTFPSQSVNPFGNVGGMRDLIGQQKPFLGQISTQNQLPIQNGYGQQTPSSSLSLTPDVQQDTTIPVPRPLPTFSTGYGSSYGTQELPRKQLIMQGEQPVLGVQDIPRKPYTPGDFLGSSSQIGLPLRDVNIKSPLQLLAEQQRLLQDKIQATQVFTEADTYCRDKVPETVIPLDEGQRFIVCLDNGKGVEQQCPKGLRYHPDSRRCERRVIGDPCASQPCLNGAQCLRTDVSSYQCQCLAGFDGPNCEFDARVCQTQQPCGQAPDTKCQSFRWGAALQYICILQDGRAYGLNSQQVQTNPCQGVDGPQPLAFTDKGFLICDGERMFVESCPGGTVWDDLNKACVWPDMVGLVTLPSGSSNDQVDLPKTVSSYGQQPSTDLLRPLNVPSSINNQIRMQRPSFEQSKPVSPYGSQISFEQPKPVSQYGSQYSLEQPVLQKPLLEKPWEKPLVQKPLVHKPFVQPFIPQQEQKQEIQFPQEQQTSGYGSQVKTQMFPQVIPESQTSLFGNPNVEVLKPQIWQQPIQRQQDFRPFQQQSSTY